MKIVDNKTEKIFNDAESYWDFYCNQYELCRNDKNNICPLYELADDEYCLDYFKKHIMECQNTLGYTVEEGKLLSLEIEDQRRYLSDKYFQALADSAERAIRRAQTGSDVFGVLARQNGASYNDWKEIRFTFTPLGLAAK